MRDAADDITLLSAAYAAGRLPSPLRLLMETRAALDPNAAGEVAVCDAVGGALLEDAPPVALAAEALDAVLDSLDDLPPLPARDLAAAKAAGRSVQELLDLPEPARGAAMSAAEQGGWRFAGPGVRTMRVAEEDDAKADLIRLEPGVGVPSHGHAGPEFTLVLCGAFRERDILYQRGDLCMAGPDVVHRPVAEPGATCIALAVTDAPLEFQGALGLMQKVLRLN